MFVMRKITMIRLFPRSIQVVYVCDPERGNEKDAECSRKTAERVPTHEFVRVKKVIAVVVNLN